MKKSSLFYRSVNPGDPKAVLRCIYQVIWCLYKVKFRAMFLSSIFDKTVKIHADLTNHLID
jgi:hypothetical protein